MSRRWFYSVSILAVTVLMLAAESSQAQRLGLFGRRNRVYYDDYYYYSGPATPADRTTTAPGMQGTQSRSFYRAPGDMTGPTSPMPVYLDVRLPAGASIMIEGEKTTQSGSRRFFVSPPVVPGHTYVYDLMAKWMVDGQEMTRTSKVYVRPGETVMVDLRPVSESQRRLPILRRRAT